MMRLLAQNVTTVFDYLTNGYQQAVAHYYEGGLCSMMGGRSWKIPSLHTRFIRLRARSFLDETITLHYMMAAAIDKFCNDVEFACITKHNVPEFTSYRYDMRVLSTANQTSDEYQFSSNRMFANLQHYVKRLMDFDIKIATKFVLARVGGVVHAHTHGYLLKSQLFFRYVKSILIKMLLKGLYRTVMGSSLTGTDSHMRRSPPLRDLAIKGYSMYQKMFTEMTGFPVNVDGRTQWVNGCPRWRFYKPDGRIYQPMTAWDLCKERALHTLNQCTSYCTLYAFDPASMGSQTESESDYAVTPLYDGHGQMAMPLTGPECVLCGDETVPMICDMCSDRFCVPCMAIHVRQCNDSYPYPPEEEKKSFKRPRDLMEMEICDRCTKFSEVFYCRICRLSLCIPCDSRHLESRFMCSGHHVSSVMEYLLGLSRDTPLYVHH